jgi:hypothetical protein
MKKLLIVFSLALLLFSCDNDDDMGNDEPQDKPEIKSYRLLAGQLNEDGEIVLVEKNQFNMVDDETVFLEFSAYSPNKNIDKIVRSKYGVTHFDGTYYDMASPHAYELPEQTELTQMYTVDIFEGMGLSPRPFDFEFYVTDKAGNKSKKITFSISIKNN